MPLNLYERSRSMSREVDYARLLPGVIVPCPNPHCEVQITHPQDALSPSGQCPQCKGNYYILTDGTVVDDAGMDILITAQCET